MGKTRSSSKDTAEKKASGKSEKEASNGGVSIFTVFLIAGVTNALIWFSISSMNVQQVEDWGDYKATMQRIVDAAIEELTASQSKKFATTTSVSSVAAVSAHNTRDVQDMKANFGNFKLTEFN